MRDEGQGVRGERCERREVRLAARAGEFCPLPLEKKKIFFSFPFRPSEKKGRRKPKLTWKPVFALESVYEDEERLELESANRARATRGSRDLIQN